MERRVRFVVRLLVLFLLACGAVQAQAASGPDEGRRKAATAEELRATVEQLQRLVAEQKAELEAQRLALREQREAVRRIEDLLARLGGSARVREAVATQEPAPGTPTELLEAQLDAVASSQVALAERVRSVQQELEQTKKAHEGKLSGLGNFRFSGDLRVRYEPFFQGGGFVTRHRERARGRFNVTGNLTEEVSGGFSLATGSLDDVNSTNQTLTGFFTRKTVGFDRYYLTYKPKWFKPLSFSAGKFAYPWLRTPLTFDSDLNPEGFSQSLSFDFPGRALENLTFVAFELPFNEVGGGSDSFIVGSQVQMGWKLGNRTRLRLAAAGIHFERADSIAVAVAQSELRPSLPNTNRLRRNANGDVIGFASRFLYLDLLADLVYRGRTRWPVQVTFNVVNNTRAADGQRTGYWAELLLGRLAEPRDLQLGYAFIHIERDAVIGAFNESDLRAATNVRNHRFLINYRALRNITLTHSLFLGRLLDPRATPSLVPPAFRSACTVSGAPGCRDAYLKRLQFDAVYRF